MDVRECLAGFCGWLNEGPRTCIIARNPGPVPLLVIIAFSGGGGGGGGKEGKLFYVGGLYSAGELKL
jgi:hypothetical protein